MELTDRELKDRKEKTKRETEEILYKPLIISKDDIDKFEEQELKRIRPIITKHLEWLINENVMEKKPEIIGDKLKDKIIRNIRTLFETEKEKEERKEKKQNEQIIKDNIIGEMRILFEQEKEEDYHEPKKVNNFQNNNYIEYESNGDKNTKLSLDEYLNKIEFYLWNIIINLQISDSWKIQLTIAINFISSKDTEEESVMYWNIGNIKLTSYSEVNEVVNELFKTLRSKYQENLETSMEMILFLIQFNLHIISVIK